MGRRVIKATPEALAAIEVQQDAVSLNGSNENFFYADESGCYISGPMSIRAEPDQIRIGTGYTFQTAYKAQIPSTCVTPQPMLVANNPVQGFASFATEVAKLLGELI